jgi:hypothetical protein
MRRQLAWFYSLSQKINRQHVQFILVLFALVLFVLGAGAPEGSGPGPK